MSDKINEASVVANISMGNNNLRRSGRFSEGRGVSVTQVKADRDGGEEKKQDWKKIDDDGEDEDVEEEEGKQHTLSFLCLCLKTLPHLPHCSSMSSKVP